MVLRESLFDDKGASVKLFATKAIYGSSYKGETPFEEKPLNPFSGRDSMCVHERDFTLYFYMMESLYNNIKLQTLKI